MKILVLGANGKTGQQVVAKALENGHKVTAMVRTSMQLPSNNSKNLTVIVGNVLIPLELKEALVGKDAVVSLLGPKTPRRKDCQVYSDSAKSIISAMTNSSNQRGILTSTALLYNNDTLLDKVLRFIAKENYKAAEKMECCIVNSGLNWTIIRLGFLNSSTNLNFNMVSTSLNRLLKSISRKAVASYIVSELENNQNISKIVGLEGRR